MGFGCARWSLRWGSDQWASAASISPNCLQVAGKGEIIEKRWNAPIAWCSRSGAGAKARCLGDPTFAALKRRSGPPASGPFFISLKDV